MKSKKIKILSLLWLAVFFVTSCGSIKKEKSQITFAGSSTLTPVISTLADDFMKQNKDINITVAAGGSSAGVKATIEKTSDFGMASRKVSDDEKSKIKNYHEYMLGYDALTISVNPENKLYKVKDSLTTEEIQKIFSGEYKYWNEVEASLPHEEIVIVVRDIGGGAHKVFQKAVMGEKKVREDAVQEPSMGALVEKIISNKNAVGYASVGVVTQNKGELIPISVDGAAPTAQNILNGSYKISRPLLVIKSGDVSKNEKSFMDYVLSDKGLKTIEKLGFVPVK